MTPSHWLRVAFGSTQGTIMELGISHIVLAKFIINVLTSFQLINVDLTNENDKRSVNHLGKRYSLNSNCSNYRLMRICLCSLKGHLWKLQRT